MLAFEAHRVQVTQKSIRLTMLFVHTQGGFGEVVDL